MRYSFISAAILALTSSVFAQTANFDPISVPTQDQQVPAGSNLDITWEPSTVHTGPITITLLQGATPQTLEVGQTIKAGLDQTVGKYTWAVPKDLQSFATYGFKITLDSTATSANPIFQFSFPFHITGLSGTSSSSSAVGVASYPASATSASTTTVHLSTGTAYSTKPTTSSSASSSSTSSSSSSSSVNSTSTYVPSTTSTVVKPTTYAASTATTTAYGSANGTLATTLKPTASSTQSSPSSTSSVPAQQSQSSAVGNMARGGFAVVGGLVLALVL